MLRDSRFATEIDEDDAAWLRGAVLPNDARVVELDEVEHFGRAYERAPQSVLYLPYDGDTAQRVLDRYTPEPEPAPVALDLFSGCGGFSLGLHSAGYDVACAVEWDVAAAHTYLANLGDPNCRIAFDSADTEKRWTKNVKNEKPSWIGSAYRSSSEMPHGARGFYVGDIRKTTAAALAELAGVERFDIVFGGPPCQGLSRANANACIEDPRNGLLWEFMRMVEEAEPKAFIIENVPALLTIANGALFNALCLRANKAGYDVTAQTIDAVWYGVPQYRKRAIIVGSREHGRTFQFPMPSHWALGRMADGERWQIGSEESDLDEPVARFDEETKTWSAPVVEVKPSETDQLGLLDGVSP